MNDAPPLELRKVSPEEVGPLFAIVRECAEELAERFEGFSPWLNYELEHLQASARERHVYAIYAGETLVGTMTADTQRSERYAQADYWADANAKAVYISKLAIRKAHRGEGTFEVCALLMEAIGRDLGCTLVRFQSFAGHPLIVRLYRQKLGKEVARMKVPVDGCVGEIPMVLFERAIGAGGTASRGDICG